MAAKPDRELSEQIHAYLEFLHRLLARWWIVGSATMCGGALAAALIIAVPRVYESRALLTWHEGVNQRRVFAPNEASAATWSSLRSRLAFLASSDSRLRRLIRELELYPHERVSSPEAKLFERMREAIRFDSLGGTSFWLSFEYPDRFRAQAVVASLVHDFIEENVQNALSSTAATRDLMESEAKLARQQLEHIDNTMARFVSDHPEFQTDPATGMLRGRAATANSPTSELALPGAVSPELRRLLREKEQLEAQVPPQRSAASDQVLAHLRQELTAAQRTLAIRLERYTDAHPDVQRARAQVIQLQAQLQAALAVPSLESQGNEQLLERRAALDRAIARFSRYPRARSTGQHSDKAAERLSQRLSPAAADTTSHLSKSARLEKRWYQLTRDRTVQKAKYDLIQERLLKARMAADLERGRALTQFEIIDPPSLPQQPIRPSRTLLGLGGSLLGLVFGLGLAGALVLFDQRVFSSDDLSLACDVPVLAMVPKE